MKKYSPELVAAQWKKNKIKGVSIECMYLFIWECKHSNKVENRPFKDLYKDLKHDRRRRKRDNYQNTMGLIPNRVTIELRTALVEKRKRYGDIEVDLLMGKNNKSSLLVTVDRATLPLTMDKRINKNATEIRLRIIKRMEKLPQLKTMTFDNDLAFSQHKIIAKSLSLKPYFTRSYTSKDKGTIENRNGVIRLFFPKKTDYNLIEKSEIKKVERELNNRPIRKLGYLTTNEVF